jgi:hypothetical protein
VIAPLGRKHIFSDVLKCKYPFVISVETDVIKVKYSVYKLLFGKVTEVGMIQETLLCKQA